MPVWGTGGRSAPGCRRQSPGLEQFGDLDGVQGRALEHLVAGNEDVKPALVVARDILTDAAAEHVVFFGRVRGHRVGFRGGIVDKLDARLAYALMGVGAVKAVEVGEGFAAARLTGSQNNDPMLPGGRFAGNHAGGILGGISSGQDIVLRVGVKPIASIAQEQQTIDVHDQPASVLIGGRHDLAAIPRIVPVLTAMTALVLADALLLQERMAVLPVPDGVDWF